MTGCHCPDANYLTVEFMEGKMQEPESVETKSTEAKMPEINSQSGTITKLQPPMESQEQWQQYVGVASNFLSLEWLYWMP